LTLAINQSLKKAILPLLIVGVVFGIYFLSNSTPLEWYKHYVYQSQAFLEGRVDLQGFPSYYHDLVIHEGKHYLASPPMPAVLLLPAVAIWGVDTDQVRISMFVGAINVALVWILLGRLNIKGVMRWVLTALFGFGTVHWEVATHGTTWFFAEIVAVLFLLLSLIEYFGKRRAFLIGILLGLAVLSRLPVLLGAIFFLAMLYGEGSSIKRPLQFLVGLALPLIGLGVFNYLRFGNPLETGYLGHSYSSYFAADIEKYGFWNPHYIAKHLYILFLMPPEYIDHFPFLRPSPEGMSILITTPAVFYAIKARFSNRENLWAALAIVGILLPTLFWFSSGWVQFGYRYSLDFFPFLFLLIISGMGSRLNKGIIALVALSIAVNLWGTLWSVHLGW
jgi:hypothetical protein